MRHFLSGITVLYILLGVAYAESKFAYVDMQRAMLEVDEGKAAKKSLEKMKKKRQKELDARQSELRKMKEGIDAQGTFMKDDVKATKMREFQTKLGELQQTYVGLQKELAQEEAKITKKILERMSRILAKMGEADKYTMIFDKSGAGLVWAPAHLDVTNDLIRRYNAGEGKK